MAEGTKPAAPLSGIEELRKTCNLLNNCNETFNGFYSAEQLLQLGRMWRACGWDIAPDQWRPRQVREALRGIVPQWDENENPKYATPHEKFTPISRPGVESKKS